MLRSTGCGVLKGHGHPDGHPNLQGVWANNTAIPFERPEAWEGKERLTREELAAAAAWRASEWGGCEAQPRQCRRATVLGRTLTWVSKAGVSSIQVIGAPKPPLRCPGDDPHHAA